MKRIPIIRTKPIQGIFDSDWDGVPNDQDCVWYDPNRHGFFKERRKRKKEELDEIDRIIEEQAEEEERQYKKNRDRIPGDLFYMCGRCKRGIGGGVDYGPSSRNPPSRCRYCGSHHILTVGRTRHGDIIDVNTGRIVKRAKQRR